MMHNDIDLARVAIAMQLDTGSDREDVVTIEELEAAMFEVPASIIRHIMPDDHDAIRFLGDFADRTALFWRLMAGDMRKSAMAGVRQ